MSLLAVRQGRLLRGAQAAVTTPCRPRLLPRLAFTATLRSYANELNELNELNESNEPNESNESDEAKTLNKANNSTNSTLDNIRPRILSNNSAIIVPTSVANIVRSSSPQPRHSLTLTATQTYLAAHHPRQSPMLDFRDLCRDSRDSLFCTMAQRQCLPRESYPQTLPVRHVQHEC